MPAEMTTSPRPHDITGCQGLRREFGHHGPYGPETKHTDPSCTASEITTSKRADTRIFRSRPTSASTERSAGSSCSVRWLSWRIYREAATGESALRGGPPAVEHRP